MTTPVPAGRGRWRFTLHTRQYTPASPTQTGIGELTEARSRKLVQAWDSPAQLTFTIDGRSPNAASISELRQEVIGWRWSEAAGNDVCMFRGPITQAEDQLTEQSHTINLVCVDYLGLLSRRYWNGPLPLAYTQTDQDNIVAGLVAQAGQQAATGNGTFLMPGSWLPLTVARVNPDGSGGRALSSTLGAPLRDRSYLGGQEIGAAIDDLAKVINGFDYDCRATVDYQNVDTLRLFYPSQGVTRSDFGLIYGSTVSTVTRTVASSAYANYQRLLGNNGASDPNTAQRYSDAWNSDAISGAAGAFGTWMAAGNAADVSIQSTLDQQVAGVLALSSVLIPSYTVGLRPGWYQYGTPNMGDTVPLVIASGRLNVNTTVRVLGITYDIGDDGTEDVELVVGRPAVTLGQILLDARTDINALARR